MISTDEDEWSSQDEEDEVTGSGELTSATGPTETESDTDTQRVHLSMLPLTTMEAEAIKQKKEQDLELLLLRRVTPVDRTKQTVPKPRDPLPTNPLPRWHVLSLDEKIPLVPAPYGTFTITRDEISKPLFLQKNTDFDTYDPYMLDTRTEYNALHDPHLKYYFQSKPKVVRRLIKLGLLTSKGEVTCNLAELNKYRKYLSRAHNSQIRAQQKREHEWETCQRKQRKHMYSSVLKQIGVSRADLFVLRRLKLLKENQRKANLLLAKVNEDTNLAANKKLMLNMLNQKRLRDLKKLHAAIRVAAAREAQKKRIQRIVAHIVCEQDFAEKLRGYMCTERYVNKQADLQCFIDNKRKYQEDKMRYHRALLRRNDDEVKCRVEQRRLHYYMINQKKKETARQHALRLRQKAEREYYLARKYGSHWQATTRKQHQDGYHTSTWRIRNTVLESNKKIKDLCEHDTGTLGSIIGNLFKKGHDNPFALATPDTKAVVNEVLDEVLDSAHAAMIDRLTNCLVDYTVNEAEKRILEYVCREGVEPLDLKPPVVPHCRKSDIHLTPPTPPCSGPCAQFGKGKDWEQKCNKMKKELEDLRKKLPKPLAKKLKSKFEPKSGKGGGQLRKALQDAESNPNMHTAIDTLAGIAMDRASPNPANPKMQKQFEQFAVSRLANSVSGVGGPPVKDEKLVVKEPARQEKPGKQTDTRPQSDIQKDTGSGIPIRKVGSGPFLRLPEKENVNKSTEPVSSAPTSDNGKPPTTDEEIKRINEDSGIEEVGPSPAMEKLPPTEDEEINPIDDSGIEEVGPSPTVQKLPENEDVNKTTEPVSSAPTSKIDKQLTKDEEIKRMDDSGIEEVGPSPTVQKLPEKDKLNETTEPVSSAPTSKSDKPPVKDAEEDQDMQSSIDTVANFPIEGTSPTPGSDTSVKDGKPVVEEPAKQEKPGASNKQNDTRTQPDIPKGKESVTGIEEVGPSPAVQKLPEKENVNKTTEPVSSAPASEIDKPPTKDEEIKRINDDSGIEEVGPSPAIEKLPEKENVNETTEPVSTVPTSEIAKPPTKDEEIKRMDDSGIEEVGPSPAVEKLPENEDVNKPTEPVSSTLTSESDKPPTKDEEIKRMDDSGIEEVGPSPAVEKLPEKENVNKTTEPDSSAPASESDKPPTNDEEIQRVDDSGIEEVGQSPAIEKLPEKENVNETTEPVSSAPTSEIDKPPTKEEEIKRINDSEIEEVGPSPAVQNLPENEDVNKTAEPVSSTPTSEIDKQPTKDEEIKRIGDSGIEEVGPSPTVQNLPEELFKETLEKAQTVSEGTIEGIPVDDTSTKQDQPETSGDWSDCITAKADDVVEAAICSACAKVNKENQEKANDGTVTDSKVDTSTKQNQPETSGDWSDCITAKADDVVQAAICSACAKVNKENQEKANGGTVTISKAGPSNKQDQRKTSGDWSDCITTKADEVVQAAICSVCAKLYKENNEKSITCNDDEVVDSMADEITNKAIQQAQIKVNPTKNQASQVQQVHFNSEELTRVQFIRNDPSSFQAVSIQIRSSDISEVSSSAQVLVPPRVLPTESNLIRELTPSEFQGMTMKFDDSSQSVFDMGGAKGKLDVHEGMTRMISTAAPSRFVTPGAGQGLPSQLPPRAPGGFRHTGNVFPVEVRAQVQAQLRLIRQEVDQLTKTLRDAGVLQDLPKPPLNE